MLVPAGSDEVQMEGRRRELQMTLEHVRDIAEAKIKASRQRTQR
jgi:hypothetical protein